MFSSSSAMSSPAMSSSRVCSLDKILENPLRENDKTPVGSHMAKINMFGSGAYCRGAQFEGGGQFEDLRYLVVKTVFL